MFVVLVCALGICSTAESLWQHNGKSVTLIDVSAPLTTKISSFWIRSEFKPILCFLYFLSLPSGNTTQDSGVEI